MTASLASGWFTDLLGWRSTIRIRLVVAGVVMLLCLYNDADSPDAAIPSNLKFSGFDIGITLTPLTAAAISGALLTLVGIASTVLNNSRWLCSVLRTIPDIRSRFSKMQAAQMRNWSTRGYDANIEPNQKLLNNTVYFVTYNELALEPEPSYVIVYSRAENYAFNATAQQARELGKLESESHRIIESSLFEPSFGIEDGDRVE